MMPRMIESRPMMIAALANPVPRSPRFLAWLRPMKPRITAMMLNPRSEITNATIERTFHLSEEEAGCCWSGYTGGGAESDMGSPLVDGGRRTAS